MSTKNLSSPITAGKSLMFFEDRRSSRFSYEYLCNALPNNHQVIAL